MEKYLLGFPTQSNALKRFLEKENVDTELAILKKFCMYVINEMLTYCNLFKENIDVILEKSKLGKNVGNLVSQYLNYPKRRTLGYRNSKADKDDTIYITDHPYKAYLKFFEIYKGLCEKSVYSCVYRSYKIKEAECYHGREKCHEIHDQLTTENF
jgi:hypothetical protein